MVGEGLSEGRRLGGALADEALVNAGETGEPSGLSEVVSGATKRNAGTWVGDVGTVGALALRGECLLNCGREKLDSEFSCVAGAREETVEFERVMVSSCCTARCADWLDRIAWTQGVMQMLFECPQA